MIALAVRLTASGAVDGTSGGKAAEIFGSSTVSRMSVRLYCATQKSPASGVSSPSATKCAPRANRRITWISLVSSFSRSAMLHLRLAAAHRHDANPYARAAALPVMLAMFMPLAVFTMLAVFAPFVSLVAFTFDFVIEISRQFACRDAHAI